MKDEPPQHTRAHARRLHAAIVGSSDDAIISKDLNGVIKSWNLAAQKLFGYTEEEAIGQRITMIIPADLQAEEKRILRKLAAGERIEHYETRRVAKDGRTIHVSLTISPIKDANGRIIGASKIARDITAQKQSEEANSSSVSRKLIEAHEEERAWIARELHDDISQRLTMLSLSLENLKALSANAPELLHPIDEAQRQAMDLGNEIQELSHRLHSSKLEYLGLVAACRGFLSEFSDRHKVQIDFDYHDIPKSMPQEIALCLFRVLQEAVRNVSKHSGASRIQVLLSSRANEIKLAVHDSGIGFEPEEAIKGHGLGLTSMKERLKLVHGDLSIESQLHGGTTVRARVPLEPDL